MSRRPPEPMRPWSDEERERLQKWLDQPTRPMPTRNEVLGAFPELLPKPKPTDEASS